MTNNYKFSLSICHSFQIACFMSQEFSIALIIEFVEIDNREVKENISFRSNASKIGMLLSARTCIKTINNYGKKIHKQASSKFNQHFCTTVMKNSDYSIRSSIKCPHLSQYVIVIFMISGKCES